MRPVFDKLLIDKGWNMISSESVKFGKLLEYGLDGINDTAEL